MIRAGSTVFGASAVASVKRSSTPPAVSSGSASASPSACRYHAAARSGARDSSVIARMRARRRTPAGVSGTGASATITKTRSLLQLDDLHVVAVGVDECAEQTARAFFQLDQPRHAECVQVIGGRAGVVDVEVEDHPPGVGVLVGDVAASALPAFLLYSGVSIRLGVPRHLFARMLANVAIEGVVGSVPFLGDAFDVAFRANRRNVRLLREHFERAGQL